MHMDTFESTNSRQYFNGVKSDVNTQTWTSPFVSTGVENAYLIK